MPSLLSVFLRGIRVQFSRLFRVPLTAPRVTDDTPAGWRGMNETNTTVTWANRRDTLIKCCELARDNPLAHRIIQITTDFVVGGGAEISGPKWVHDFWEHPLNALDMRVYKWCDALSTQGELFLVLSRNPIDGMSYVREIPATDVDQVDTDPDDIEHELRIHQLTDDPEGRWWTVAHETDDAEEQVILHYTINRPPGDVRGYSDLWHTADYLAKYDLWLQDRVRINRYKGAYLWHCRIEGAGPAILDVKRAQYSKPPSSGTILVTDANEKWEVMQPTIAADDVEADGRALRLMIAAGSSIPLHFLSEGESATRATAREMGTPTYRHFAHRQYVFEHAIVDMIQHAARRAGKGKVDADVTFDMVLDLGEGGDPTGSAAASDGTENQPQGSKKGQEGPNSSSGKRTPTDTGTDTQKNSATLVNRPTALGLKPWSFYKRAIPTGGSTCYECYNNNAVGWIPIDQPYPSAIRHPEWLTRPPFHPNCDCGEEIGLFQDAPPGPFG